MDNNKILAAIDALTKQIARLAWALEIHSPVICYNLEKEPCHNCGSQLVTIEDVTCKACGEEKKIKHVVIP